MSGMYDRICTEYEAFSPRSREAAVAARDVFPGGDTRSSAHFAPYPLFIERAAGAFLHIDGLGELLRQGFNKAFQNTGIRGQAIGLGSLSNIHLTNEPIGNARVSLAASRRAGRVSRCIHLGMLMRGVASAARLMYCTSTAMTTADINVATAALQDTLLDLREELRREKPELLN